MNNPPPAQPTDIEVFANHCVFMWSIYLHNKTLFEDSSAEDRTRMVATAPYLFGDLNKVLNEYIILQVCKITDPAQDHRKNDNHSIAFLLTHYAPALTSTAMARLRDLEVKLNTFRDLLLPARNKIISHSDRKAILAGNSLGVAPQQAWNEFWHNLQELICIMHEAVIGHPLNICGVGMASDAHGLLKSLVHGECFEQLLKDENHELVMKYADLALQKAST